MTTIEYLDQYFGNKIDDAFSIYCVGIEIDGDITHERVKDQDYSKLDNLGLNYYIFKNTNKDKKQNKTIIALFFDFQKIRTKFMKECEKMKIAEIATSEKYLYFLTEVHFKACKRLYEVSVALNMSIDRNNLQKIKTKHGLEVVVKPSIVSTFGFLDFALDRTGSEMFFQTKEIINENNTLLRKLISKNGKYSITKTKNGKLPKLVKMDNFDSMLPLKISKKKMLPYLQYITTFEQFK